MKNKSSREYRYPLKVNEGTMLGNGHIGLLVWGSENVVNVTLGCSDLWDHRGGAEWEDEQTFENIGRALYEKDVPRLKDIFKVRQKEGEPSRPSLIPVGRIAIKLKEPCTLYSNRINLTTGTLKVRSGIVPYPDPACDYCFSEAVVSLDAVKDIFTFNCGDIESWSLVPAFDSVPEMVERGFARPLLRQSADFGYFIQEMPNVKDGSYSVCVIFDNKNGIVCSFERNRTKNELERKIADADIMDWNTDPGFTEFWKKMPEVVFEDQDLQRQFDEALFKFQSMTRSTGAPAGLQGPWIEDNRMPPWQGDYHFNINVQMCYSPALRAGLFGNLRKMLDMVWSWRDGLRKNAKTFLGIDNGYMLPHAVDDTGRMMGGFWTGMLDHGCTAWIAQIMFDYADYTGDMEYMKEVALDFMTGAFNVYYAMMEKKEGRLWLSMSISPEYMGAHPDAWGANASFQLAACHRLTRNLIRCAKMLGLPIDERWNEVERLLPEACLLPLRREWGEEKSIDQDGAMEIGLWEGKYLEMSHRHHSHLAGICPFNTIDPNNEKWADIVKNSIGRWSGKGMFGWTGWCIPWAMALQIRLGNPDTAMLLFDIWRDAFLNKGGNSTHDAVVKGVFEYCFRQDMIQMDATMGMLSALQDLLMYDEGGVLHFFSCARGACSVKNIPAPGGFLVSGGTFGHLWNGKTYNCILEVRATRNGILRVKLNSPCGKEILECVGRKTVARHDAGQILEFNMKPEQKITLRA